LNATAYLPFARPTIDEETISGVAEVLRSGWITSGPRVREFEERLSEHCGGRPVRALNSGTAGLEIGLALAGVGPGDEVITTPLTWVGTANVIVRAGARVVFVDIDARTHNLDLAQLEAAIGPATRLLLPVDLAGLPVNRAALYAIARRHRLRVLEDAAQSIGAASDGVSIGSSGDLVSFSFHANKNLTTAEGGCLVLNDASEARRCELWRLQGVERFADGTLDATLPGGKYNMTDVAARLGLGQLARLPEFTARRRALARHYFQCFDTSLGCELPVEDFVQSNWHMFQVVLPPDLTRGAFIASMHAAGIGVGVHYPAVHLLSLYRDMGHMPGAFPVAERVGAGIVTLPLFPSMQQGDVERVCSAVTSVIKGLRNARR
jgi:dTDP-4-amino-4,6-dideoxygalactose transaminase